MKMKMKKEKRSHKHDINRPTYLRHRHKYSASVWQCLYALSNTYATFEAQLIKILSNNETELKKSNANKKRACMH